MGEELTVEIHAIPGVSKKTKSSVWRCPKCRAVLGEAFHNVCINLPQGFAKVGEYHGRDLYALSNKAKRHPTKDRSGRDKHEFEAAYTSLKLMGLGQEYMETQLPITMGEFPVYVRCCAPCRTVVRIEQVVPKTES